MSESPPRSGVLSIIAKPVLCMRLIKSLRSTFHSCAFVDIARPIRRLHSTAFVATEAKAPSRAPSAVDFFVGDFKMHRCPAPSTTTKATKEELLQYFEQMNLIRRMEMAADALYKTKLIRGFCHLSTGQEAIPVGIEAILGEKDAVITAYRCHGFALLRGATVASVLAELLGRRTGVSCGKGGSMHMYGDRFFGGNGIVGAQVPVGAGIAFAQWYREEKAVTFALYGDGAANQGQIFEAYNQAALLKLPIIFVCENNHYAMGTSIDRSSASTTYYSRGDYIPGVQANGMDVLSVRTAAQYARDYALAGKGPLVLELVTYRYGGHSMSDPGTTYRTRDEIQQVRSTRDAVKHLQQHIIDARFATEADCRAIEKRARSHVEEAIEEAKAAAPPEESELWTHIYEKGSEPEYLRGVEHDMKHRYQ